MNALRKALVMLVAAAALAGDWECAPECQALAQTPVIRREYELKAKILLVLGETVTWPAAEVPPAGKPLIIGILGGDPFVERGFNQLDTAVAAARAKGRLLEVQRFDSAKDYEPCHILFISNAGTARSEEKTIADRLAKAIEKTAGSAVLVVGESSGLAQKGASANLVFDSAKNKIRLEINPAAASRSGLSPQPGLLRMTNLVAVVRDP